MKRKHEHMEEDAGETAKQKKEKQQGRVVKEAKLATQSCPYLDTINRKAVNFDFEKVCSVTLSKHNVYVCLVCGQYFQGRGHGSPAETHSVQVNHHVFMNLQDARIFCLPDNYEVMDSSLEDIQYNLKPVFTKEEISSLDEHDMKKSDLFGRFYYPGITVMNDVGQGDYVNAVIISLAQIPPIRDFFLDTLNYEASESTVVHEFGLILRKIWNRRKLKASVGTHAFMDVVSVVSNKKFDLLKQADCNEFLKFLLHELHIGLGGNHRPGSSIIHQCFQGAVNVETEILHSAKSTSVMMQEAQEAEAVEREESSESSRIETDSKERRGNSSGITGKVVPAIIFSLELPLMPLFKDSKASKTLVPEVDLSTALKKFNGRQFFDSVIEGKIHRRRYRIKKLPPYLIFHVNRFTRTHFGLEKNTTVVNLNVHGLDMKPFLWTSSEKSMTTGEDEKQEVDGMKLKDLKKMERGIETSTATKRKELSQRLVEEPMRTEKQGKRNKSKKAKRFPLAVPSLKPSQGNKFKLISTIGHKFKHDLGDDVGVSDQHSVIEKGSYTSFVLHKPSNQWHEIQNMHKQETMPQLVACSEAYIAFYEYQTQ